VTTTSTRKSDFYSLPTTTTSDQDCFIVDNNLINQLIALLLICPCAFNLFNCISNWLLLMMPSLPCIITLS